MIHAFLMYDSDCFTVVFQEVVRRGVNMTQITALFMWYCDVTVFCKTSHPVTERFCRSYFRHLVVSRSVVSISFIFSLPEDLLNAVYRETLRKNTYTYNDF